MSGVPDTLVDFPTQVGASFSPRWAPASSADDSIIEAHFEQLRKAKVGVAVVSWYPPGKRDANGPEVDGLVKRLLAAAARFGLELCLHLEPWEGRTAAAQLQDVAYAVRTYGAHEAYHKIDGKCVFFAYLVPARRARLARGADRGERRRVPHRAGAGSEARRRLRGRPGRLRRGLQLFWRYRIHASLDAVELERARRTRIRKGRALRPVRRAGYDDLRVRDRGTARIRGAARRAPTTTGAGARRWRAARARRRHAEFPVARGHADRDRGGGVHAGAAGRHYVPGVPVAGVLPDEDGGLGGAVRGGAAARGGGARLVNTSERL